ncbi:MAG: response regulator [Halobacteriales archaeon]
MDDDPDFVEMARVFLERVDDDLTVRTETSALDALDRLADESFDAVISDYQMPRMNGIEFLRTVREEYPDLPFILCTARGSEEVATEAIAADVTDYIQKGTDMDQWEVLANRLSNAIDRHRTSRQLWEALGLSQHLMQQDLVGVYVVQDGQFIYVNDYVAEALGYAPEALVGEPVASVSIEGPEGGSSLDAIPADAESARYRSHVHTASGRVPVDLEVSTIEINEAPAVAGVLRRRDQHRAADREGDT